jgi:hypothetical protein
MSPLSPEAGFPMPRFARKLIRWIMALPEIPFFGIIPELGSFLLHGFGRPLYGFMVALNNLMSMVKLFLWLMMGPKPTTKWLPNSPTI